MKTLITFSVLTMSTLAFASDYEVGAVFTDGQVREVQLFKLDNAGHFTEETSIKLKGTISKDDMDQIYRILNGRVESVSIRDLTK